MCTAARLPVSLAPTRRVFASHKLAGAKETRDFATAVQP